MEIRKIYVLIVVTMMLAALAPLVFGASTDNVIITFDPEVDIDINVDSVSYNYSAFATVYANAWTNTSGGFFTLWNNGTAAMDTQIRSNDTTDEGNMIFNFSGVAPVQDQYAFYVEDLSFPNYINNTYGDVFDNALAASGSKTFDICLLIGTTLSANHSWQTTTIYFQGTIDS